jgi:hypothetical protein
MTRKRYIKLGYALMQKINTKNIEMFGRSAQGWGKVLAHVQIDSIGRRIRRRSAPGT